MTTVLQVKVKAKNQFKNVIIEGNIFKTLVEEIKAIPEYQSLKQSIELFEWVLQTIDRNLQSNVKIDKVQLAKKILHNVFVYQPNELIALENQLLYLIENKIIKKTPFYNFYKYLKNIVKNNFEFRKKLYI